VLDEALSIPQRNEQTRQKGRLGVILYRSHSIYRQSVNSNDLDKPEVLSAAINLTKRTELWSVKGFNYRATYIITWLYVCIIHRYYFHTLSQTTIYR